MSMTRSLFKYSSTVCLLIFVFTILFMAGSVQAQRESGGELVLRESEGDSSRDFETIQVESPQSIPSRGGEYWGGVLKKASLFFTFNPVQKAQKALTYAQESMELASLMIKERQDYQGAARAIQSANGYISKLQGTSAKWSGAFSDDIAFKRFLSDVDLHIQKRNAILAGMLRANPDKNETLNVVANAGTGILQALGAFVGSGLANGVPIVEVDISKDQDGDGMEDSEEPNYGTNIRSLDTDNDALSDAAEVEIWNTDPLKDDTDGDGFRDGLEVIKGYNPKGTGLLEKSN